MKLERLVAIGVAALSAFAGAVCAQVSVPPPALPSAVPLPGVAIRVPAGAEVRESAVAPSRWQQELDRLDADLRLRLLTANDPPTDWLAAEIDATDIESQVRHYAAARVGAPADRVYLAALAVACLRPVRPTLPACDAVDRLADWSRRDADNGVPSMLLAGRARVRGDTDAVTAYIDQAAAAPRFDDYAAQQPQRWWQYLRPLDVGIDAAAKARAAANYGAGNELAWASPLRAVCVDGRRGDRMRTVCAALGQSLAARGATFALRRAGARVAEINAADAGARSAAQSRGARLLAASARCAQWEPDFAAALESPDAASRARGVEQFAAWADARAQFGEVAACERVVANAPR